MGNPQMCLVGAHTAPQNLAPKRILLYLQNPVKILGQKIWHFLTILQKEFPYNRFWGKIRSQPSPFCRKIGRNWSCDLQNFFGDKMGSKGLWGKNGQFFIQKRPFFGHFCQNFHPNFDPPPRNKLSQILAVFGRKTAFFKFFFKNFSGVFVAKYTLKVWDSYYKHPKSYLIRRFVV